MRAKLFLGIALLILVGLTVLAIRARSKHTRNASSLITAAPAFAKATPTDRQIQFAEARIKRFPAESEGYNLLAAAYLQKARETGDFGFNARAESALKKALELAPADRTSLTVQATLQLTYHRFREALEEATRVQASGPESAELFGIMT